MAPSKANDKARKRRASELDELGGWLVRDARRLLRKRGSKLGEAARAEVDSGLAELERLLAPPAIERDLDAVHRAAEGLDRLLDRHLSRYRKSPTREYLEAIGGAVLLALLIRAFVFEAFKIPTGSMIPTLHVHDHLFVNKFIYGLKIPFTRVRLLGLRAPQRGEIIVFEYPYEGDPDSSGKDLIKRVIGTPGDRVQVEDNRVLINGTPIALGGVEAAGDCGEAIDLVRDCPDDERAICLFDSPGAGSVIGRFASRAEALAQVATYEGYRCQRVRECSNGIAWTSQHRVVAGEEAGRPFALSVNDPSWPPTRFDPLRFEAPARAYLPPDNAAFPAFVVPEGKLLVMGDNRDNSKDGRYFGLVPFDTVKGKAGFIFFAYAQDFWRPDFDRIGRFVHDDADDPRCDDGR